VQQAGTPFAVILTQVPHQGGEGQEAHAGFAAKGVTMSSTVASTSARISTRLRRSAERRLETDPDSKAAVELRRLWRG
jgi:chromosome partitioning protein